MPNPVIIVHSFEQACAALSSAVELSQDLTLLSAPDAGMQTGPAWFLSLVEQATDRVPGAEKLNVTALLDCGDTPGPVLTALRHGLTAICFTGRSEVLAKLRDIAQQQQAEILHERPKGLDLLGVADPQTRCHTWLARGSD